MRRTTKPAPARRLGLQTLRGTWQRLSMVLLLMMLTTMTAWAQGVAYIDANGVVKNTATDDIVGNDNPTVLTGGEGETKLSAGWYVVNSDISYTGTITLGGDVNIILADGKTMIVNTSDSDGIYGTSYALTIYGQTLGTGTLNTNRPIYCAFTMTGGTVNATSNPYAIRGTTTVSGGTLNATGQYAIGDGDVTVTGGTLTVTSTEGLTRSDWPYGYKRFAITGNLALSGPATVTLNGYVYDGVTIADGLTFTTDGTDNYSGTLSFEKQMAIQGKTLSLAALQLADAADNTDIIANCNGATGLRVTLSGRTLYKDGNWNTLCLPFNVKIAGSVLDGSDVRTLSSSVFDNTKGELTLNFTDEGAVTTIEAGKPYIIKWTKPSGYDSHESDYDISNPMFSSVTISNTTTDIVKTLDNTVGQEKSIAFCGIFSPLNIGPDGDNTKLYLGTGNKLYYPSKARTIKSCRAYFQLYGLTAVEPDPTGNGSGSSVRAFNLNFGDDGETTGIVDIEHGTLNIEHSAGSWYSLDGRKLDGKPTKKGLYINNGRKVVIK